MQTNFNQTIDKYFETTYSVIEYCLEKEFILQALILIYATIDAMASLNRDENKPFSDRADFIKWVSQYLLKNQKLNCTAIELYAARCAIIHTATAESKLTNEKGIRGIYYSFKTDENVLQKILRDSNTRAKAVNVNKLFEALQKANEKFINVIKKDSKMKKMFEKRYGKFLKNLKVNDDFVKWIMQNS